MAKDPILILRAEKERIAKLKAQGRSIREEAINKILEERKDA